MKKLLLTLALLAGPASVYGFKQEHVDRLLQTKKCPACDLKGADFTGADLSDANLSDAILPEAILPEANLWGANLRGAYLEGTDLTEVTFDSNTTFKYAVLKGTKISRKALGGAGIYGTLGPIQLTLPALGGYHNIDKDKPAEGAQPAQALQPVAITVQ